LIPVCSLSSSWLMIVAWVASFKHIYVFKLRLIKTNHKKKIWIFLNGQQLYFIVNMNVICAILMNENLGFLLCGLRNVEN
jgi:hypothetical protein